MMKFAPSFRLKNSQPIRRWLVLGAVFSLLTAGEANAGFIGQKVDLTYNIRDSSDSLTAFVGPGDEFAIPVLGTFILMDFEEETPSTMSLSLRTATGSLNFGIDLNTDDFLQFTFPGLPGNVGDIVAFTSIVVSWNSFPDLSFSNDSIRLDHSNTFHNITTSPNEYLIQVPEPTTALLLGVGLIVLAIKGRRRKV